MFEFDLLREHAAPQSPAVEAMCGADLRHFVVSGETQPNYFPAYGFGADDAYSFHLGTRFLLEMGVQRVELEEPPGCRERLLQFLSSYAPPEAIERIALAALFACGEQFFAVYDVLVQGTAHYCMGCDCPPGCYQLTQNPPQVALRLHLGKLIRAEGVAGRP